jgi:hypothetical protein
MTARSDLPAGIYIGGVAAVGAVLVGTSLLEMARAEYGARILLWAAISILTIVAGRLAVQLPVRDCRVSFSDTLLFLSILLFGPTPATLTGAIDGYAASSREKGAWYKRLFNTAAMAISVNLAARLSDLTGAGAGLRAGGAVSPANLLLAMILMTGAQYFVNTALVSGVVALKDGASFLAIWQDSTPWAGTAYALAAAAVAVVFLSAREIGAISFIAVPPLPAVLHFTYRTWLNRPVGRKGGITP